MGKHVGEFHGRTVVQNFRMKKSTLLFICSVVQIELEPKAHLAIANNYQTLSVDKQVAKANL